MELDVMKIRVYGRFDSMTPDSVAWRESSTDLWNIWRDGFEVTHMLTDDDFTDGTYQEYEYRDGQIVGDVLNDACTENAEYDAVCARFLTEYVGVEA